MDVELRVACFICFTKPRIWIVLSMGVGVVAAFKFHWVTLLVKLESVSDHSTSPYVLFLLISEESKKIK